MAVILVAEYNEQWQKVIRGQLENRWGQQSVNVVGFYEEALYMIQKHMIGEQPYEFYVIGDIKSESNELRDPTDSGLTIRLLDELTNKRRISPDRIAVVSDNPFVQSEAQKRKNTQAYSRGIAGGKDLTRLIWDVGNRFARR